MADEKMEAWNRLRYKPPSLEEESGDGCEKMFWLKSTLDRDINLSGAMNFVVPADYGTFTDTSATYISLTCQVFRSDGSVLTADDQVFLSPGSLQSIISSVQINLNGAPLDPSNAYSYSSTLTSYLGLSKSAREDVWKEFAGARLPEFNSSKLVPEDATYFEPYITKIKGSKSWILTGRLMSDFLQSCAQLVPPGVKLEVNITRNPDAFVLCSCSADQSLTYKLVISSASLFIRRIKMNDSVLSRCQSTIANGAELVYTRMGCIINQIPATGVSYRCGNLFNGGALPFSIYLVLVNQKAFSGSQSYLGNFFESGYLRSVQVFENGRPILPQPMRTKYMYLEDGYSIDTEESDGTEPFLTVTQALNGIADSRMAAALSYKDFLRGCIVSCCQINSCNARRGGRGFIDVELTFDENIHREPLLLLTFAEYDKRVKLDANLNVVPY